MSSSVTAVRMIVERRRYAFVAVAGCPVAIPAFHARTAEGEMSAIAVDPKFGRM
jgi:hypothetical protein